MTYTKKLSQICKYGIIFTMALLTTISFGQNLLPNGGFENNFNNWNNLAADGSIASYFLANDAKEGNKSLKLVISKLGTKSYSIQNLNSGWNAEIGKVYKINFYAKSLLNNTELKIVQATNGFRSSTFALTKQWKLYEFIYVAVGTTEKFGMHFPNLDTYFIDGITIEGYDLISNPIPPSGNSSLKSLAANCGLNMANLGDRTNEPDFERVLRNDFNMLGSENSLKMKLVKRTESGGYSLAGPDKMVAYAQANNMKLRGHTIIWHNGMPDWVNNKNWTRNSLLNYLKGYIQDIVGRYKGKIDEWDVANEFVKNDGSGLRDGNQSVWMRYIGPAVLDSAFKWVHEADPDAKLYYNDYSAEGLNAKSNYIYNMVKGMKERGVPIDGVGLQCHFKYDQFLTPNVTLAQEMDANIKRLGALGLEVAFTEIDIAIPTPVKTANYKLQAITYGNLLQIALNNPSIVKTFMIWGISDKYTWITDNTNNKYDDPLFYDRGYKKKLAYDQMVAVLKANCSEIIIQQPYSGRIAIPGTVQLENYDLGGEGVAFHDTDNQNKGGQYRTDGVDIGGGPSGAKTIGWTSPGEWLEYSVNVNSAGKYDFEFTASSKNGGGVIYVLIDGQMIISNLNIPKTEGWNDYTTFSRNGIQLAKGNHILRVNIAKAGFNLDKIIVSREKPKDCAGVSGGLASVDACGICSGGNTGITPKSPRIWYSDADGDGKGDPNNSIQDCNKPVGYVINKQDQCPNDGNKSTPGSCGCGNVDADSDNDGVANCNDQCPNDGNKTQPGECGCGIAEGSCSNYAPTVSFTRPLDGQNFEVGTTLIPNVLANDADGSIANVKLYVNGQFVRQENFATYDWNHKGQDTALQNMTAGTYVFRAVATDNEGMTGEQSITITVKSVPTQIPYAGVINLPGVLQAENYDKGGQGIAYNDVDVANKGNVFRTTEGVDIDDIPSGGFALGWTATGEWQEYSIDVASAGNYNFEMTYSSGIPGALIGMEIVGGNMLFTNYSLPQTASWNTYVKTTQNNISLPAGQSVLRINTLKNGFNLDKVVVVQPSKASEVMGASGFKVNEYPNPIVEGDQLTIEVDETAGEILEVSILSSTGGVHISVTEFVNGGQLDTSLLPAGSHILRVVTEGGVVNKRILKL